MVDSHTTFQSPADFGVECGVCDSNLNSIFCEGEGIENLFKSAMYHVVTSCRRESATVE